MVCPKTSESARMMAASPSKYPARGSPPRFHGLPAPARCSADGSRMRKPGRAPMQDAYAGWLKKPLFLLEGVVALVLPIACANVAGLLLAQASAREREVSLRAAVGSSRWRRHKRPMPHTFPTAEHLHQLWGVLVRGRRPRRSIGAWIGPVCLAKSRSRGTRADQA
jgi:hypothetical protein